MQILKLFLLTLPFLLQIDCKFKDFQYVKIKRFKCTSDFKFVYENLTCFAKPLNRNQTGVNLGVWFKKPLIFFNVSFFSKIYIYVKLIYRLTLPATIAMAPSTVKFCEFLSGIIAQK